MSKNQAFLISVTANNDLCSQIVNVIFNRHFFIPYAEQNNIK